MLHFLLSYILSDKVGRLFYMLKKGEQKSKLNVIFITSPWEEINMNVLSTSFLRITIIITRAVRYVTS